jgi:hypothetical protein
MTQSYLHVIKSIELFAQQHLQVKRFICDFRDYIPNHIERAESFPIIYVTLDSVTNSPNINTYSITVGCVVKQNVDRSGIKSDLNNCERILSDLYVWLRDGDLSIDVGNEPSHTTLNNEFLSGDIGLEGTFDIIVDGSVLCDIPFENGIPSDYPVCSDAYYEVRNLEGELLDSGSIGSGAFKGIVVDCSGGGCPSGTLTDEDGNYLLDEDGNCISGEGCAYVNYVVKYEDDTPIESGSVESGGSIEVVVPNCPIPEPCEDATVENSDASYSDTVVSGGALVLPDETINIKDKDDNIIDTITFPVYSDVSIDIDTYCTPTNDAYKLDGDFYTLDRNNPFGNTNRFTDILGTQVYATAIVIDWLTARDYAETVLGYGVDIIAGTTYAVQVGNEPYTIGAFSGFVLIDSDNLWNLLNKDGTKAPANALDYSPFNYVLTTTVGDNIRSRNNYYQSTASTWVTTDIGSLASTSKTNNRKTMIQRQFTYTELGL